MLLGSGQGSHCPRESCPCGRSSPVACPPCPSLLSILPFPTSHSPLLHCSLRFSRLISAFPSRTLHPLTSTCLPCPFYSLLTCGPSRRPLPPPVPVTPSVSPCRSISERCPHPSSSSCCLIAFQGCSQPPRLRSWSQALGNCVLEGGKALPTLQIESRECQRS